MRHSFTATTTAASIAGSLFIQENQAIQSIVICNLGSNPVFFTKYGTATATDCIKIPADTSFEIPVTQAIVSYSFITTGGNSVVVLETF
jgi:hypothetical protein